MNKKRKKTIKKVISEVEYARQLHIKHSVDFNLSKKERNHHKKVVQQKIEIIKALKKEIPTTEEHIELVIKWRSIHWAWIEYFAHYAQKKLSKKKDQEIVQDEKENGSVNWHFRWIKTYWWVLYYLNKSREK